MYFLFANFMLVWTYMTADARSTDKRFRFLDHMSVKQEYTRSMVTLAGGGV